MTPQIFISKRKDFRMFNFFNSAKSAEGFDQESETSMFRFDTDAELSAAVIHWELNGFTEDNGFFIVAVYSDGRQDQRYSYMTREEKLAAPQAQAAITEAYAAFDAGSTFTLMSRERAVRRQTFSFDGAEVYVFQQGADNKCAGEVTFTCFDQMEAYLANAVVSLKYKPSAASSIAEVSRAEAEAALGSAEVRKLEAEHTQVWLEGKSDGKIRFIGARRAIRELAGKLSAAGLQTELYTA